MSEITLTGGTLLPSPNETPSLSGGGRTGSGSSGGNGNMQNQYQHSTSHSHSHSHSHGGHGNHGGQGGAIELMQQQQQQLNSPSLDDLVNSSKEEIARALSTLVRFGRYEALVPLLEQLEARRDMGELLQQLDEGGHSLYHWAAKRVDEIRFLQCLVDLAIKHRLAPQVLNVSSEDNVGMRPLHWACTEGSIPHAALLLRHGADLEAKDSSGCTPLLIAAQYGQVEVVAYLLKRGANIQAVDTSWDTAMHWAAYKGSIQVCGLLAYYQTLSFSTQDAYGQTPVHLAALRGHTSVVRYILQRLPKKDVLFLKDKNERTPLDLAIHKNRPNVEAILREAMAAAEDPRGHFFRKTLWSNLKDVCSVKTWKSWMGLTVGMDEMDEPTKTPYYFMIANFILHFGFMVGIFAPFFNLGQGLLWDMTGWLSLNFVLMILTWIAFYKTVTTSPGYLDESCPDIGKWRKLYEETLEAYADENSHGHLVRVSRVGIWFLVLCFCVCVCLPRDGWYCPFRSWLYSGLNVFLFWGLLLFLCCPIPHSNFVIPATLPGPSAPSIAASIESVSSSLTISAPSSTIRSASTITNTFTSS